MAATGIGNAVGYVPVLDGGNPRIVPGKARQNISGGVFVFASGADGTVSSGLDSYVTNDIEFAIDASGLQFNGIAVNDTASGNTVAVATKGACLVVANGTVTAGFPVLCDGENSVANTAISADAAAKIGRALTSAASGGFCIVDLNA